MTWDAVLVLVLGAWAIRESLPAGLPEPHRWPANAVAFGAAVAYALATAAEAARPRAARLCAAAALAALFTAAVALPAASLVSMRRAAGPAWYIHDGPLQVEIAAGILRDGRNPYAEDFSSTPLADWGGGWRSNPAIRRYTYLPLSFLATAGIGASGLPTDPRYVAVAALLVAAAALGALAPAGPGRRAVVAAALLNPFAYAWGGEGDGVGLALLALGLLAGARGRPGLAGLALGAAVAWKESTWPMAPLLAIPAWAGADAAGRRRLLLGAALAPALTIAPFVAWDARAFREDVVLYKSGGVPDAYAIGSRGGWGIAALLEPLGIAAYHGRFPFWALQAAVGVPLLAVLGRWVLGEPTPGRAAAAAVLLFLPFAYLGRYLHPNHLAPVVPLLVLASSRRPRSEAIDSP